MSRPLSHLKPRMEIVYGGNRVVTVPPEVAEAFREGDRLIVLQDSGDLLHVPAPDWDQAEAAVDAAVDAFSEMGEVADAQVTVFYETFATKLEDDATFELIAAANNQDLTSARDRGRSTTRLVLSDDMRRGIGLRGYAQQDPLNEFRKEAFRLYEELSGFIRHQVASSIFRDVTSGSHRPTVSSMR